jgi:hypothetical protein
MMNWKDLEGSCDGLIEVHFAGGVEETKHLGHDSWCPGQNLDSALPKYKSGALPLSHPSW